MWKKILIVVVVLAGIFAINYCFASPFLKEGDIVFQISKSSQSPYIVAATRSPWSHCGVIVEKDGKKYVLEAVNVVKLTPYSEWKKRGLLHIVSSRRVFNHPVKINYKKYLGKPYDLAFRLNNGRYYCSELVWDIYKTQLDTTLAQPHPVGDFNVKNAAAKSVMARRGIAEKQLVVAPSDLR